MTHDVTERSDALSNATNPMVCFPGVKLSSERISSRSIRVGLVKFAAQTATLPPRMTGRDAGDDERAQPLA
jgi:hypothetical protein